MIVSPVVILVVKSFQRYFVSVVREHWVQVVVLQDLQVVAPDHRLVLYLFILPVG